MDKLSLVLHIDKVCSDTSIFTPNTIHQAFFTYVDDGSIFVSGAKRTGGFRVAKRIKLNSVTNKRHFPQIEYDYIDKVATRLRIDFVPVDIGMDGLSELHAILTMILPNGWGTFIEYGKITRIDIAVDFPDKKMVNWLFLPTTLATTTVWKSDGKLETYQQGKPKGNITQIYDRKAKRSANNTSQPGKVGIRVERRLRNQSLKLHSLSELKNAYSALSICRALANPPPEETKSYIWDLFLRAVDRDTLTVALGLLPQDKRKIYKSYYEKNVADWWNAEEIWKNWPKYLKDSQMGDLSKWC